MRTWIEVGLLLLLAICGVLFVLNDSKPTIKTDYSVIEVERKSLKRESQQHEKIAVSTIVKAEELTPKIEKLITKTKVSYTSETFERLPSLSEDENDKNELIFNLIKQNELLRKANAELQISLDFEKKALINAELEITLHKAEMEAHEIAVRNARFRGMGEGALAYAIVDGLFKVLRK